MTFKGDFSRPATAKESLQLPTGVVVAKPVKVLKHVFLKSFTEDTNILYKSTPKKHTKEIIMDRKDMLEREITSKSRRSWQTSALALLMVNTQLPVLAGV